MVDLSAVHFEVIDGSRRYPFPQAGYSWLAVGTSQLLANTELIGADQ
jgi:hypothetical protein